MPLLMSDLQLAEIERHANLWGQYGDPSALTPGEVAALIAEIRELHRLRDHLIALNRQALERLEQMGTGR